MKLHELDPSLRSILFAAVFVLSIGVGTGLIYLGTSGGTTPKSTVEHYRGEDPSTLETPDDIPEHYPMPIKQLLMITHSHIISFALIFAFMGILVWHTSLPRKLRYFLAVEPIWGTLVTFGSIWLVRYIHPAFVWVLIASGLVMYSCYFLGVGAVLYTLKLKKMN